MSHNRHLDSQVRVTSRKHLEELGERTTVDVRSSSRRDGGAVTAVAPLPSVLAGPRARPMPGLAAARAAKGSPPPHNVIPFAKPLALAQIAAAYPSAVMVSPRPMAQPALPVSQLMRPTLPPAPAAVVVRMPAQAPAPAALAPAAVTAAPAPAPAPAPMGDPAPVALLPARPVAASAAAAADAKWAVYEDLGLGAPKPHVSPMASPRQQQIAKLLVSAYRLLGFAILTIIVVVLIGYISTTAFFYMSSSWIVPMAIAPTDEKVVTLQAQLADLQTQRDRLDDELQETQRSISTQQEFQAQFARAIKGDLAGRKAALTRVRALAQAAASTRQSIKNQNNAYASSSRKRMGQEYEAGLIDRNTMLSGKFQLAQITSSNLTLQERQAEFETQAQDLEDQTRSLDLILADAEGSDNAALSYEVLKIKQELEASRMDLAKAIETRDTLKTALARQDKMVASFQQSAYLRAVADGAQVAFVPYANLANTTKGSALYACKLGMVACFHVGEVLQVLPGEVQFKHPNRDKMLRGQLVELKLDGDDLDAASRDVLFAGGKPLLF